MPRDVLLLMRSTFVFSTHFSHHSSFRVAIFTQNQMIGFYVAVGTFFFLIIFPTIFTRNCNKFTQLFVILLKWFVEGQINRTIYKPILVVWLRWHLFRSSTVHQHWLSTQTRPIYQHLEECAANWHLQDDSGVPNPADVAHNLGLCTDFGHRSHYCTADHSDDCHYYNDFYRYICHHHMNFGHHKDFFRYSNSGHHKDFFRYTNSDHRTDYSYFHTDYFGCNCRCTEKV